MAKKKKVKCVIRKAKIPKSNIPEIREEVNGCMDIYNQAFDSALGGFSSYDDRNALSRGILKIIVAGATKCLETQQFIPPIVFTFKIGEEVHVDLWQCSQFEEPINDVLSTMHSRVSGIATFPEFKADFMAIVFLHSIGNEHGFGVHMIHDSGICVATYVAKKEKDSIVVKNIDPKDHYATSPWFDLLDDAEELKGSWLRGLWRDYNLVKLFRNVFT
jgi:hypothetical protein